MSSYKNKWRSLGDYEQRDYREVFMCVAMVWVRYEQHHEEHRNAMGKKVYVQPLTDTAEEQRRCY